LQDYLLQLETYPHLKQGIGLRFTGLIVPAGIVSPAKAGDMFLNCRIIYLEQEPVERAFDRLKEFATETLRVGFESKNGATHNVKLCESASEANAVLLCYSQC
jgi:hypothetical protein